ncbi:MAG: hypothetical protein LBK71_01600, partial [Verrucomicrobiales bacterium]|nr:hypothetical protein [Verrucomicrobiales bacterium]
MNTPNMKTRKLTLILTLLCALSASALNVLAEVKYVTPGQDITEENKTYEAVTGSNALRVTSGTYTGTNIVLSSTVNIHTAYILEQGALTLTGGTVSVNADLVGINAVYANGTSTATLANVSVMVSGSYDAYGINAINSSTVSVTGGAITISGTGDRYGHRALNVGNRLNSNDRSQITAENLLITVQGRGFGAIAEYGGVIKLKQVTILSESYGLNAQYGSTIIADQTTVEAYYTPIQSHLGGTLIVNDSLVIATGSLAALSVANDNTDDTTLIVSGGTLRGTSLLTISGTEASHAHVTLNDVDTTDVTGGITSTTSATVDINGGTGGLNGDITNSGSGTLAVNLNHSTLTGDVTNDGDGVLVITLDNNSVGTGGFAGGHLIIGSDSAWAFDQNSTTDRIDNHGVIHLGASGNFITIHSDTISGDGTWLFPVNSDTGAKSTVTGSTDADS